MLNAEPRTQLRLLELGLEDVLVGAYSGRRLSNIFHNVSAVAR